MAGGNRWLLIAVVAALMGLGLAGWTVASAQQRLTSSALYNGALTRARTDSRVVGALGEPIEPSWMVSGTLQNDDTADMRVSISGPKAKAQLSLRGSGAKRPVFERLWVELEEGATIDLLDGNGQLLARTSEDCASSQLCLDQGRCAFEDGDCVPADDYDCAESARCKSHGACSRSNPRKRCVAMTPEHCRSSTLCRSASKCNLVDGRCQHHDARACGYSHSCWNEGLCSLSEDDTCVAASNADCERSAACKRDDRCVARSGVCVTSGSPRGAKVRIGSIAVAGDRLPVADVNQVIKSVRPQAVACYEAGLARRNDLEGTVRMRLVIGRDGRVSNASSGGSDLNDDGVLRCVTKAFYDLRFNPPIGGSVTVSASVSMAP